MTLSQLIANSGLKITPKIKSKIGHIITKKAIENGVKYTKVPETIFVNEYPETFTDDMEKVIIDFFTPKC